MEKVSVGGFVLNVGGPGIIVYGKYGGTNGKYIKSGSKIFYGFYNIKGKDSKDKTLHYRSSMPMFNDTMIIDNDVYNFETKKWGKSLGAIKISTNHLRIRNMLTF